MIEYIVPIFFMIVALDVALWFSIFVPVYLTNRKDFNAEAGLLNRIMLSRIQCPLKQDPQEVRFARYWLSSLGWWILTWVRIHTVFGWQRTVFEYIMLKKDQRCGGIMSYRCWRARVIEEECLKYIHGCHDGEGMQIVMLGAGWDSRAIRLAAERQKSHVKFFEVDLPEIQEMKKSALNSMLRDRAVSPDEIADLEFVACNLEEDDMCDLVLRAGFNPEIRTLVLCEGVFIYLSESGIRNTFRNVGNLVRAGRGELNLIFDYFPQIQCEPTDGCEGVQRFLSAWQGRGNPIGDAIGPESIEHMVQQEGYRSLREWNIQTEDWRYPERFRGGYDLGRVVLAHFDKSRL